MKRTNRQIKKSKPALAYPLLFWALLVGTTLIVDRKIIASHQTSPAYLTSPSLHPQEQAITARGGVGDSYHRIMRLLGPGIEIPPQKNDANFAYSYEHGTLIATYAQGRVMNLTYTVSPRNPRMTIKQAEAMGFGMLPIDAKRVSQFTPDAQTLMVVYHSKTLGPLFSPLWSMDDNGIAQPHSCTLEIIHTGNRVDSLTALLGQSP